MMTCGNLLSIFFDIGKSGLSNDESISVIEALLFLYRQWLPFDKDTRFNGKEIWCIFDETYLGLYGCYVALDIP